ncbi:MAG: STAS domain-containing protein [Chloroflexi bacterium]|nr:STAS domain-containing protein [Chloroflexota bacterium]
MDIEVSEKTGRVPVTIIHIKGSVDTSTYDAFQASGEKAFNDGARYVLLDLTEVSHVTSAGFRAISQMFKLLRGHLSPTDSAMMSQGLRDGSYKSPNLKLLNPNPRVLEALKLAGFDTFLEIYYEMEKAIGSF